MVKDYILHHSYISSSSVLYTVLLKMVKDLQYAPSYISFSSMFHAVLLQIGERKLQYVT